MFSSLLSMSGFETINNKRNSYKKELISCVSSNTLKTINSFRTLPLIKSKSFSSCSRSSVTESSEAAMNNNSGRRRLSWLERRKSWTFKRTGNKRNTKTMECSPDITIIFSKDAEEWDEYLTQCFKQMSDSQTLTILHEKIESIKFPLSTYDTQSFSHSRAVLLILSPDLLDFIDENAEVFELTRLLNPKRTVVMLCGVQQHDISRFHRAALASYDQWTCLVAKDQDKEFVLNIIQTVLLIHQNCDNSSNKPQFKLTPRKVREGSGKVFVMLETPISPKQQIDILIDGSNENQVTIKWKNPYNLYFTIPDDMLRVARVMNISLVCDNKNFLGTRPLKCDTKMSELHSLLSSVNSPFEFMCQTMGYATLSQLDRELANRFEHRLTHFGSLFANDIDVNDNKKSSDCYLPTLLHFASAYGLRELTSKLLHCPLAYKACQTRNNDNLTPAQLARYLNHNDIGALLEDFQRLCETEKFSIEHNRRNIGQSELTDQEKANLKRNVTSFSYSNSKLSSAHHHLYGLSLCSDLLHVKSIDHLSDTNKSKESLESNEYEYVKQQLNNESHFKDMPSSQSISDSDSALNIRTNEEDADYSQNDNVMCGDEEEDQEDLEHNGALESDNLHDLTDRDHIHNELIGIIEQFKKGMSFGQFETIFENWQKKYCNGFEGNVSKELNESLTQIKNLCEIGRKHQELENNKYSLNFNDLRSYLSSKLNNKFNDNSLKQTLRERLQLLSLSHLSYPDSLNSYSSSSTTNDSSIDGSNQSTKSLKTSNESQGFNRRHNQNNYYKRLKTKVLSLVEKQSEPQTNMKQSDSRHKPISSRPPAPPPRPLTLASISEANKANRINEFVPTKSDLEVDPYYNYCHADKSLTKSGSDHQIVESGETASLQSCTENKCNPRAIANVCHIKSNSMSDVATHQYVNLSSKGEPSSPVLAKRDPLMDYDLVPSGIPVPINALRAKAILTTKPPKHFKPYEYDYDIPKVPKYKRNDTLKKQKESIYESNVSDKANKKEEKTIETQLQIFV